jgi:hypothetical protein
MQKCRERLEEKNNDNICHMGEKYKQDHRYNLKIFKTPVVLKIKESWIVFLIQRKRLNRVCQTKLKTLHTLFPVLSVH